MSAFYLGIAIIAEIIASSLLKKTDGFKKLIPTIIVGMSYIVCFYFLSLSLIDIPIGIAYAIWSGLGTVLTAIVGVKLYQEKLSSKNIIGIVAIILGVILLNIS